MIAAFISCSGAALFVIALMRNRAALRREQELRHDAEEQLKALVESSPAAIITIGENGAVLAANRAAARLVLLPSAEALRDRQISRYLPVLGAALQFESGPEGLRAATQCQGIRENGEIFLANLWFSSWQSPQGKRLAAIVVDASEEMRDREEENLRQVLRANQIAAAAVSHEVRNLCSAVSLVSDNLLSRYAGDPDVRAMSSLVEGLGKLASLPARLPMVAGERHGLLQVCLNLAQNSLRASSQSASPELSITASLEDGKLILRFEDAGAGVAEPDRLFAPFQPGANGAGLGLYVSRAI